MRQLGVLVLLILAAGCGKNPRQYVDTGNRFLQAHKYGDATINFRKALQKDPKMADAFWGLAQTFLAQGKAREAYFALTRTVELAPQNLEAKRKLANLALAGYLSDRRRPKNLYDQLNKLAGEFLARDPNSYDGLRLKAYILLNDNQRSAAIDYFRKAREVKPGDTETTVLLGGILLQEPQTAAEGEKLLLDLIHAHSESGPAYDTLYQYYVSTQRLADAENILKRKVAANPKQAGYVVELAEYYRRTGKVQEMNAAIGTLLNDSKMFPKGLMTAGDFYNQSGDREQALKYYAQGAQTNTDDKLAYQKRSIATLTALGRADQALALIEESLRAHPKDSELHMGRALILMNQNKIDRALAELQQQDQEQKDNASVKYQLGRALLMNGKGKEASAEWQQSATLQPNWVEPKIAMASYSLDTRRYDDSLRWAEQAVANAPGNVTALLLRADALQGLGRQPEAQEQLSNMRRQYPGNTAIELAFAFLTLRENKPVEAEKIFRAHYTVGQADLRPLTGLVESLLVQKRNDDAMRILQADLAKAPGRPAVEMMLANSYGVAGQTDAAVRTMEKLAAAHPDLPQVRLRLGQVEGAQGNMQRAVENFQKARDLAPQSTDALLGLAEAEERLGRNDAARQDYQAVLKIDPFNMVALNNFAYLTAETGGNLDEALQMIETATHKVPKQPNLSDTLGYVYLKQKKVSSALQVFGELTQQYPANPTFRFHHALALLESGSKDKARKELEAALADKPSTDLASKIKEALGRS